MVRTYFASLLSLSFSEIHFLSNSFSTFVLLRCRLDRKSFSCTVKSKVVSKELVDDTQSVTRPVT